MTDSLDARELAFRATLDPTMPAAEVEEAVTDWLRRQPEAMAENGRILSSRLDAALNELRIADQYASYLGWDVAEWELADICQRIANLHRSVGYARETITTTALPGRLVDGEEAIG